MKSMARNSSLEMLRIVAMMMIVTVHLCGSVLGLPNKFAPLTADAGTWGKVLIESIAIIGVNLFVLISGYFGIKLTAKSLFRYVMWCTWYAVAIFAIYAVLYPQFRNFDSVVKYLLPFSTTDLWFVREYLFLMLISPVLNAGLAVISRKQYFYVLLSLAVINCYFGWIQGCKVNPTGYTLMQLVLVYTLGRFFGLYLRSNIESNRSMWRMGALGFYLASLALIFVSTMLLPKNMAFAYNSPFVIVAAISFFLIFASIKMQSRIVNLIASSAFAVYLIHKNPLIWGNTLCPMFREIAKCHSGMEYFLIAAAALLVIFIGCVVIDKPRAIMFKCFSIRKR